jgi:hypothetical protein
VVHKGILMKTPIEQHEYDLVVETLTRYKRRWEFVKHVLERELGSEMAQTLAQKIMDMAGKSRL